MAKDQDDTKPRQRVKFRHPETGETHSGHIHSRGHQGATVVSQDGQQHQVSHGDYMHHDEDKEGNDEQLKKNAIRHLSHGGQSRMARVACAALLRLGGVPNPLELGADDLIVKPSAVLIKPERLRVKEPPELVEVLRFIAEQADGELFRGVQRRDLREYAEHFSTTSSKSGGGDEQRMAKAVASALVVPALPPAEKTWAHGTYQCEWREGATGMGYITIRHPALPMAYHEAVGSLQKAVTLARRLVREFESGTTPHKGVFKRVAG